MWRDLDKFPFDWKDKITWTRRILIILEKSGRIQNSPVNKIAWFSMDIVDRTGSLVNISAKKNKKYLSFKGNLFFYFLLKSLHDCCPINKISWLSMDFVDRSILLVPKPRISSVFFTGRYFLPDAVLADPLTKCFVTSPYSTAWHPHEALRRDFRKCCVAE